MKKITSAVMILFILIAIFLLSKGNPSGKTVDNSDSENIKEFEIKAFQFGYNPDIITVNQGDKVKIKIDNTDVLHGIRIPDLNVKGNEIVEFIANKTGEFAWYCTNFCGDKHREMSGRLIIK